MSQDQDRREEVTELLRQADESSRSLVTGDGEDEGETALLETAERANALLEEADPDAILEAVGLDTLPDGTEPDSIPEAIARGDESQVEDLKRLLNLAKLADSGEPDALEGAADTLRESADADGDEREEPTETEGDEPDRDAGESDDSAADESSEDESLLGSIADEVTADESDGGETEESDEESGGGVEEEIRSALESSLTDFGDEVQGLRERLERASGAVGDRDGDESGEPTAEDEPEDAEEEDELLETDLGIGGEDRHETTSKGVVRHSTMAPPPSDRSDMRGTGRFSTMPDKN